MFVVQVLVPWWTSLRHAAATVTAIAVTVGFVFGWGLGGNACTTLSESGRFLHWWGRTLEGHPLTLFLGWWFVSLVAMRPHWTRRRAAFFTAFVLTAVSAARFVEPSAFGEVWCAASLGLGPAYVLGYEAWATRTAQRDSPKRRTSFIRGSEHAPKDTEQKKTPVS